MPKTFTITGDDTLTIFGRVITDLAEGAVSSVVFNNDFVGMKTGKNGNTAFAKNETGNNADMTLRIMRGSADDQFLQARLQSMEDNFSGFVLAQGQFVKRLGDGQGNVVSDVYTLQGGVFPRKVGGLDNTDGETEQAVATYTLRFAYATRSIK
jgi:hypothetical protein